MFLGYHMCSNPSTSLPFAFAQDHSDQDERGDNIFYKIEELVSG